MSLTNQTPNYAITAGDHSFDDVQINDGNCVVIQTQYAHIVATDVKLPLEQSVDGVHFDVVLGSVQTLNPAKTSHSWNWPMAPVGIFVRVAVINGSGKAGSISKIDYLV